MVSNNVSSICTKLKEHTRVCQKVTREYKFKDLQTMYITGFFAIYFQLEQTTIKTFELKDYSEFYQNLYKWLWLTGLFTSLSNILVDVLEGVYQKNAQCRTKLYYHL